MDSAILMPAYFGQSKPVEWTRPDEMIPWKNDFEAEPKHLNSRTRKRYRDNRPDEEQIHSRLRCDNLALPVLRHFQPRPSASSSMRRDNTLMLRLSPLRPPSMLQRKGNRPRPCTLSGGSQNEERILLSRLVTTTLSLPCYATTAIKRYQLRTPWRLMKAQ